MLINNLLSIQKQSKLKPWDSILKRFATFVSLKRCHWLCNSIKSIHFPHIASVTIKIVSRFFTESQGLTPNEQQWHGKTGRNLELLQAHMGVLVMASCIFVLVLNICSVCFQMQATTMANMFADRNFNKRLKRAHPMSMMMKGSRSTVLGSLAHQGQSTKSRSNQQHLDFLMCVYFDCYGRTVQEVKASRALCFCACAAPSDEKRPHIFAPCISNSYNCVYY